MTEAPYIRAHIALTPAQREKLARLRERFTLRTDGQVFRHLLEIYDEDVPSAYQAAAELDRLHQRISRVLDESDRRSDALR